MSSIKIVDKLLIIRGVPGSGKSYYANLLLEYKPFIIDPDKIDIFSDKFLLLKNRFKDTRLKILKYKFCLNTIQEVSGDINLLVWIQPWRKIENIDKAIKDIKDLGITINSIFIIEFYIDLKVAWERLIKLRSYKIKMFKNYKLYQEYCNKYKKFENCKYNYLRIDVNKTSETSQNLTYIKKFINRDKSKV